MIMDLQLKPEHNLIPLLTKTNKNHLFHPMLDLLSTSTLSFALTLNPPIYESTLREFWSNATIITHNQKTISISSSIQSHPVSITPETLNTHLQLRDDDTCVVSFDKTIMQSAFVEDVGYPDTLSTDTLWKGYLPSCYRYLLHTLMVCFSRKCGSFDQASIRIQELFYALIKNKRYSLSNYLYTDLVANHFEKSAKNKFLMYPRFLSFVLSKVLDQSIIAQGEGVFMKSQTVKVFTSMARPTKHPIAQTRTLVTEKPTEQADVLDTTTFLTRDQNEEHNVLDTTYFTRDQEDENDVVSTEIGSSQPPIVTISDDSSSFEDKGSKFKELLVSLSNLSAEVSSIKDTLTKMQSSSLQRIQDQTAMFSEIQATLASISIQNQPSTSSLPPQIDIRTLTSNITSSVLATLQPKFELFASNMKATFSNHTAEVSSIKDTLTEMQSSFMQHIADPTPMLAEIQASLASLSTQNQPSTSSQIDIPTLTEDKGKMFCLFW